jgi:Type II secretion system (T2SS), protein M subtype b
VTFEPADRALLLRRLRFIAVNAAAACMLVGFVIVPFAAHVAQMCEDISERADLLARLQQFKQAPRQNPEPLEAVFFAAPEERLASADLHALLKTLTQEGGLQLLGLRSVTPRQPIAKRSIAVGLEVEGPAAKLRDTLVKIETARPILVVTDVTLRPTSPDTDGVLRAELIIQGALRPPLSRAAVVEYGR